MRQCMAAMLAVPSTQDDPETTAARSLVINRQAQRVESQAMQPRDRLCCIPEQGKDAWYADSVEGLRSGVPLQPVLFGGGEGTLGDRCVGHHTAVLHEHQQSRPDVAVLGLGQPCAR